MYAHTSPIGSEGIEMQLIIGLDDGMIVGSRDATKDHMVLWLFLKPITLACDDASERVR